MIPMMVGLLTTAIASGRTISRIGRYKVFPIAGTAILAVGMYLLSRLGVGTAPWLASVYMFIVGAGIGLVMQVLVLVVQNDAPPAVMGVATSTATFFRSVGGSFGVAVFGAIFASRLRRPLGSARARAARSAAAFVSTPGRFAIWRPTSARLHERVRARVAQRVPLGSGAGARAVALAWLLKEVPLRETLHKPASPVGEPERLAAARPSRRTRNRPRS